MTQSYLALGGNAGDVARAFEQALDQIGGTPGCTVTSRSSNYDTTPVGARAGDRYLNATAGVETTLEPLPLLDLLQTIEAAAGRVRTIHWGPRPLDLDLVFFGSEIVQTPRLSVPHPAAWYRRFVLDPLTEIAPQFVHPLKQVSIASLRERLLPRPFTVALAGGAEALKQRACDEGKRSFPSVHWSDWDHAAADRLDPVILFWLGGPASEFDELPLVPRLDVTSLPGEPLEAMTYVLQAALG
ncbi:MAG: 2-amino-4-hydroxy-6-hydroxymethyldihydropteridine diphosphokinase [Planctomycetes bacterium]|nr:2-amino-4-hydroxy-6-hydroxymethyldihydropteridine diphosphokinase [Planctomycetota bacterium]